MTSIRLFTVDRRSKRKIFSRAKMASSAESRLCVLCKKAVNSTEIVFVCGLWCRKFFHNKCVGLSNSEARALSCKKERIKFHCDTCENRLRSELLGEKETQEPKQLDNCLNNNVNLLELVQNLLVLTKELSNDNSTIKTKLDRVLSSNARLEEYILQSPKCFGKQNEEIHGNSAEYVESDCTIRIADIRGQNNDVNHLHANSCTSDASSHQQQTDSSLNIASDLPEQLTNSQDQNGAEGCSSHEWEVPDDHNSLQDPLTICKEECTSPEDFPTPTTFRVEETEDLEDAVKAVFEDCGQELKHEVELPDIGTEPESTIPIGLDVEKIKDNTSGFIPGIILGAVTGNRMQCTTIEETSRQNKFGTEHFRHRCNICKKTFPHLQDLNEHMCMNRNGLLHSCRICHKTFKKRSSLKVHFRSHTGERPYSCGVCKKAFTQNCHLKVHSRVHTGERPYSCQVCQKSFKLPNHVKEHMLSHSSERHYSCEVCHKRFKTSSARMAHLRLHIETRTYKCNICLKKFPNNSQFRIHLLLHRKR